MAVIIPFALTPEQQERLLSQLAVREEGDREESLQSLRQREEDIDTLKRCSQILSAARFADGVDLSTEMLLDLLALVRALATNPNLDARLLAAPGEPAEFNGLLRDLLYGSASLPIRLRRFLARRNLGNQTALQLLCSVFPTEWPLITQAGVRQLDLTRAQERAAIETARIAFGMAVPADASIPAADLDRSIPLQPAHVIPDNDPVVKLLGQVVAYRAVREFVAAPDYVAVHRLLTSDLPGRNRHDGANRERGRSRHSGAPYSASAATARSQSDSQVREPQPIGYDAAFRPGQPPIPGALTPPDLDKISTAQLLAELDAEVANRGFSYPPLVVRNYFICLQTKPYVWLLGANGIGKTRLTSLLAELLTGDPDSQYRLIPVRPDWADSAPVLGYVNMLAAGGEGRYISTPFLDFLLRAALPENASRAYFLCLDEMNLARVEHYFAEVLSGMETYTRELLLPNGQRVRIPTNLFITGTLNTDEATYPLSRKVVDRGNTISLQTVSLKHSRSHLPSPPHSEPIPFAIRQAVFLQRRVTDVAAADARLQKISKDNLAGWIVDLLMEVNAILEPYDLPIAYRLRDETLCYCANSFDVDGSGLLAPTSPDDALANLVIAVDFQLLQKVVPRLGGTQDSIGSLLRDLFHWAEGHRFTRTAAKLNRLLGNLQRDGFVSYE